MTIQFDMIFRGLCLFVPKEDRRSAKVHLVDTRGQGVPAHDPRLRIRLSQVANESTWTRDGNHPDNPDFGVWNLDDVALRIEFQAAPGLRILGPKAPEKNHPQNEEQKSWFCWVPNLADAVPSIEGITTDKATCTIDLDRGTLSSDRLDKNEWRFSGASEPGTRTFARTVKLELEGVEPSQGVTLSSNKGSLQLRAASESRIVVVCENNPAPHPGHSVTSQQIDHFRLFYDLCKLRGGLSSFPVPKVAGKIVEPIGNGSTFCPDGRYEK